MRLAIPFAVLLAATTAPRHGCGPAPAPYDPCGGKTCGDACTTCAPGDPDCMETMVVKACDLERRCVAKTAGICDEAKVDCFGKRCGEACVIAPACYFANPSCTIYPPQGLCDTTGTCATSVTPSNDLCIPAAPPPSSGCVGKRCGDACGVCPPGTDPTRCPVPTFAATACDAALQCVTVGTFTCPSANPCAGKRCGDACDPCGGLCMSPVAYFCDRSSACVPGVVTCSP
jgi:hypothetical protein